MRSQVHLPKGFGSALFSLRVCRDASRLVPRAVQYGLEVAAGRRPVAPLNAHRPMHNLMSSVAVPHLRAVSVSLVLLLGQDPGQQAGSSGTPTPVPYDPAVGELVVPLSKPAGHVAPSKEEWLRLAATTLDVVQGKLEGAKARFSRERLADLAEGVGSTVGVGEDLRRMVELTDEQFVELGRKCARELDLAHTIVALPDPRAARLSALVSPHGAEDGIRLSVKLYDSPTVNAFALPDGSIRVYTGLLDLATDDELRAVIGHEIGHVVQQHSKSAAQVAMLGSAGAKAALSATQGGSPTGDVLEVVATHIAKLMVNAKYSRMQERRADDYAFAFIMAHGYSTDGMLTLFGKLGGGEDSKSPFASHPASGARAERIRELVAKAAGK